MLYNFALFMAILLVVSVFRLTKVVSTICKIKYFSVDMDIRQVNLIYETGNK